MQAGAEEACALAGVLVARLHRGARSRPRRPASCSFACPACGDVLQRPVTSACGHTCCRACVRARCSACGAPSTTHLTTNVLVQSLVERWWSAELLSARAAQDAERLLHSKSDPEAALNKCNKALHFSPKNHQLLAVRSQVLNSISRYSEALEDAESIVKSRPTWSQGHFVKGVVLFNLNKPEEALTSFCVSASLCHSTQLIKKHITLCLSRLVISLKRRHQRGKRRLKVCLVRIQRSRFSSAFNKIKLSKYQIESKSHRNHKACSPNIDQRDYESGDWQAPELHTILNHIFTEVKKYSDMSPCLTELQVESILVDQSDFECVLCCRSLWRPVTTPCGHTYCLQCLERCLDYSSSCPLCMKSLAEYLSDNHRSITTFIEEAMRNFIPTEYIARKISHTLEIIGTTNCEPHIPVFVCTTAFPSVSCPLFVFEPRYRLMVRRCLEAGTRQFGIAACSDKNATGPNRYAEFGTVLEIKDCVLMGNGCSILSTVGLKRFRVLARGERDGYDMARIEIVEDSCIEVMREKAVIDLHDNVRRKAWLWFKDMDLNYKNEITQTIGVMPDEEEHWTMLRDGPSWTWWVVAILPLATQLKVMILATPDLEKRLRAIDRTLDYIYFLAKKQTTMNERALTYTDPPSEYFSSP